VTTFDRYYADLASGDPHRALTAALCILRDDGDWF
jgi:hypothetical protein